MVWIGGAAFIALALVPSIRKRASVLEGAALLQAIALRFRTIGWASLALLVATGYVNLLFRGIGIRELISGAAFQGQAGKALAFKLMFVAAILAISGMHDFLLGPAAADAIRRDPDSVQARRGRRTAAWMGRAVLIFGLAVSLFAVAFVRGGW